MQLKPTNKWILVEKVDAEKEFGLKGSESTTRILLPEDTKKDKAQEFVVVKVSNGNPKPTYALVENLLQKAEIYKGYEAFFIKEHNIVAYIDV